MRTTLILLLIAGAMANGYYRHWGNWWVFGGVLAIQLIAIKEIWAFYWGRDIKFVRGPAITKDAGRGLRIFGLVFYFGCYFLMFLAS